MNIELPSLDWILHLEGQTGKMILNPDIPQDEAARQFVQLINEHIQQALKNEYEKGFAAGKADERENRQ